MAFTIWKVDSLTSLGGGMAFISFMSPILDSLHYWTRT